MQEITKQLDQLYDDYYARLAALKPLWENMPDEEEPGDKYLPAIRTTTLAWHQSVIEVLKQLPEKRYASQFQHPLIPKQVIDDAFPILTEEVVEFPKYYLKALADIIVELKGSLANGLEAEFVTAEIHKSELDLKFVVVKPLHLRRPYQIKQLRAGQVPDKLFDYLIAHASERDTFTKSLIESDPTSHLERLGDMQNIAINSGFKGTLREKFMPICTKETIRFHSRVNMTLQELNAIVAQLKS